MGKKCKKKVQWRRLSLNEAPKVESEEKVCVRNCRTAERDPCTPPPFSKCGDDNPIQSEHEDLSHRLSPKAESPRGPFERGESVDRNPNSNFSRRRPFHVDQQRGPHVAGPPFQGLRRKPFKIFGRGGGPPSVGEVGHRRRWSQDEELIMEDRDQKETSNGTDRPIHTVFINNEEYTKVKTPRQEVIFKKSCLDRKSASVDSGSSVESSGDLKSAISHQGDRDPLMESAAGHQGDQTSMVGSADDTAISSGHMAYYLDKTQHNTSIYPETCGMFMGDPDKPPLAGVVMQQAYPGGPMISIPVQWTPFLDPGLIPGDTALTTLDPAFTRVIDPNIVSVDPAHILPVQHDANGCPVTVQVSSEDCTVKVAEELLWLCCNLDPKDLQVKVDSNGMPVEIEPSTFTVSLSTLDPCQQDVLFHKSNELVGAPFLSQIMMPGSRTSPSKDNPPRKQRAKSEDKERRHANNGKLRPNSGTDHNEYFSDSQYASMSEASTAPTTPSGELCDSSDGASGDSKLDSKARRICGSEGLDSEFMETEPETDDSCSFNPSSDSKQGDDSFQLSSDEPSGSQETRDEESSRVLGEEAGICEDPGTQESAEESKNSSLPYEEPPCSTSDSCSHSCSHCDSSDNQLTECSNQSQEPVDFSTKNEPNISDVKRLKKGRSLSMDSSYSCSGSPFEENSAEVTSKHQAKRVAKKLRKEKKRLSKDRTKMKSTQISSDQNDRTNHDCEATSQPGIEQCDENQTDMVQDVEGQVLSIQTMDKQVLCDVNEGDKDDQSGSSHLNLEVSSDAKIEGEDILEIDNKTDEQEVLVANNDVEMQIPEEIPGRQGESLQEATSLAEPRDSCENSSLLEGSLIEDGSPDPKSQNLNDSSTTLTIPDPPTSRNLSLTDNDKTLTDTGYAEVISKSQDSSNEHSEISGDQINAETENNKKKSVYTCKPGFVMVPILTPYYDPSVLFGYPLVMQEYSSERNYNKKKKKKWKRKFQLDQPPDMVLDAELYMGDPLMATSNGYLVPVDSSQLCQLQEYHYLPNIYPPIQLVTDEGFVSIEHSPYFPESLPDPFYQKDNYYGAEKNHRGGRFPALHDAGKEVETNLDKVHFLTGQTSTVDSTDSGLSESEEMFQATRDAKSKEESPENGKDAEKIKVEKVECFETKKEKEEEISRIAKQRVEKKKKKDKLKKWKIEIQEPDFASFSSLSENFEFRGENESKKKGDTKTGKGDTTKSLPHNSMQDSGSKEKQLKGQDKARKKGGSNIRQSEEPTDKPFSRRRGDNSSRSSQKRGREYADVQPIKANLLPVEKMAMDEDKPKKKKRIRKKKKVPKDEMVSAADSADADSETFSHISSEASLQEMVLKSAGGNQSTLDPVDSFTLEAISQSSSLAATPAGLKMRMKVEPDSCSPLRKGGGGRGKPSSIMAMAVESQTSSETAYLLHEASGLQSLGVTDAVKKWMEEITPEKAFAISDENRKLLLSDLMLSREEDDSEDDVTESKNGAGNPSIASLSKKWLDDCDERVAATRMSLSRPASSSQLSYDDEALESECSSFSLERLCSVSSCSSFSALPYSLEENLGILEDPSQYNYFEGRANFSFRSSVLTSLLSEDEPSLESRSGAGKSEKVGLKHANPFLVRDLPSSVPYWQAREDKRRDFFSSTFSSGLGSSLASTPVTSPRKRKSRAQRLPSEANSSLLWPTTCSVM